MVADLQAEAVLAEVHHRGIATPYRPAQDRVGEEVLHAPLEHALERSGAEFGVVPFFCEGGGGCRRDFQSDLLLGEVLGDARDLHFDDGSELMRLERFERQHLVEPVQELGAEELAQLRFVAQVAGHQHERLREVDDVALAVGQASIVQQLEQDVEDLGVRLFDFVEQHDRMRFAAHGFGQGAAFVVTDITRGRADQPRHGVLFHELAHVHAHKRLLVVEEELGERAGGFRFADARRTEQQERPERSARLLQSGARAAHRFADRDERVVLAHDTLGQALLHAEQLLALGFEQPHGGNARPTADDTGDDFRVDLFGEQRTARLDRAEPRFVGFQVARGLRQFAVADLADTLVLPFALLAFRFGAQVFDQRLAGAQARDEFLFAGPARAQGAGLLLQSGEFRGDVREAPGFARAVFLLQRGPLDLQLARLALEAVEFRRQGVDRKTQLGRGFVDTVDSLVGQKPRRDVAVREARGLDQCFVENAHAVVDLVALF